MKTAVTANQQVANDMIRHQTYVARHAAALSKDARGLLKATEEKVQIAVLNASLDLEGINPASPEAQAIYSKLEADIAAARDKAWDEIRARANDDAMQFADADHIGTLRIIEDPFPVVLGLQPLAKAHLRAIATAHPFEGHTLSQWLKRTRNVDVQRITTVAKSGMVRGLTPTQVARSVVGSPALKNKDGASRRAFNDVEALYLTVTNGISNQIKQGLYAENADVIKEERFVATLDLRTTLICAGNDGKLFKRGEGPIPPLHFRCRSTRVPYINPDNLGNRPYKAASEKQFLKQFAADNSLGKVATVNDLPRGYKTAYNTWARAETRKLVGQVPATHTFNSWLKTQSKEFQDEYLGVGKADLFRQGKLSLDKFVTRDGYELPIKDLLKLVS